MTANTDNLILMDEIADFGRELVKQLLKTADRDRVIAISLAMLTELGVIVVWRDDREARPGEDGLPPR